MKLWVITGRQSTIGMTLIFILVFITVHAYAEDLLPTQPPTGGISLKEIWKYNSYTEHPEVTWSPDGKWLLFGMKDNKTGKASTVIAKPDGSEIIEVADHLTDRAGWIDNQRLWYRVEVQNKDKREPTDKIIIYDIKSKKKRQIDLPCDLKSPILAVPSRAELVYFRGGNLKVKGIEKGQSERELIHGPLQRFSVSRLKMSRDGKILVASVYRGNEWRVFVMRIDAASANTAPVAELAASSIDISADGQKVAYIKSLRQTSSNRYVDEFHLLNLTTGGDSLVKSLVHGSAYDGVSGLTMSPDGRRLTYFLFHPALEGPLLEPSLFITDLQTGNTVQVLQVLDIDTGERFRFLSPINWSADSEMFTVLTLAVSMLGPDVGERPLPPSSSRYNGAVLMVKADGTELTYVSTGSTANWSPMVSRLATTWGGHIIRIFDVNDAQD